jgi:hypothetical protein
VFKRISAPIKMDPLTEEQMRREMIEKQENDSKDADKMVCIFFNLLQISEKIRIFN